MQVLPVQEGSPESTTTAMQFTADQIAQYNKSRAHGPKSGVAPYSDDTVQGLFNVLLICNVPGAYGQSTAVANGLPLTFVQATTYAHDRLKALGEGIPGFPNIADVTLQPIEACPLTCAAHRDAWLMDFVARGTARRNEREAARLEAENRAFTLFLAGLVDEAREAWAAERGTSEEFTAWLKTEINKSRVRAALQPAGVADVALGPALMREAVEHPQCGVVAGA